MKRLKEIISSLSETVSVTKLDGVLLIAVSALLGILIGMFCSPRKYVHIGCNNGNSRTNTWEPEEEAIEDADDEEGLGF